MPKGQENWLLAYPAEFPVADLEDLARLGGVWRIGVGDAGVVQADAALLDEAAGLLLAASETDPLKHHSQLLW